MTWEKQTPPAFKTWDFKTSIELVGVYREKRTGVGANKSNIYIFEQEDGKMISVWGTTALMPMLDALKLNEKVKIVYLGKKLNPKTKRNFHNFDVFKETVD